MTKQCIGKAGQILADRFPEPSRRKSRSRRTRIAALLVPLVMIVLVVPSYASEVTLAWDPHPDNLGTVAGYKIYLRLISGNYAEIIDAGNTTAVTVSGLNEGVTYYFASTAYDQFGNESAFSNEISKTIAATAVTPVTLAPSSPVEPEAEASTPAAPTAPPSLAPPVSGALGYSNLETTYRSPGASYSSPVSGGKRFQATGTANVDFTVVHSRIVPDPGNPVPAGTAIIGLRSDEGVLMAEVIMPASTEMQSGAVPVEVRGSVNTGIAISNQTTEPAQISFSFTDDVGTEFGNGSFTLDAQQQVMAFLNHAPFHLETELEGTFVFTSSVPVGVVALRGTTDDGEQFVFTAVPVVSFAGGSPEHDPDLLPFFVDGGGWTTDVVLTNPTSVPQSGTVQFFGQGTDLESAPLLNLTINGVSGQVFPYSIPPKSSVRLTTGGAPAEAVRVGSARVAPAFSSAHVPTALAIVSFNNGGTRISEGTVSAVSLGSTFRAHVVSSGAAGQIGTVQSGLAIANPSVDPTIVTIEITKLDGTSPGLTTQSIRVPAGGQVSRFINELVPNLPDGFEGIVRLTAASPIGVSAFRLRYNEHGHLIFSSAPALDEATTSAGYGTLFPYIVSGGGYSTEVVLFGQAGQATSGGVLSLSPSGIPEG